MNEAAPGRPALTQRFADRMGALLGPDFPQSLGLAVSGGGDSMAMLHLAAGWARVYGITLRVVTVNHRLRPESADEAALVADEARGLGLSHDVLNWEGWDGQGNVMDAARRARHDLIGAWRGETRDVLMAHTRDDVAETFLMRVRRGAGADGLAAMAAVREMREGGAAPWRVVRPLLDESRAELRHYADTLRIPYIDDPTNDDLRFDRSRMRRLLAVLEEEGLDRAALAGAALRLGRARTALHARAADVAARLAVPPDSPARAALWLGDIALDRDGFADVEQDTQLRLLRGALQFVTSADYAPRGPSLDTALDRVLGGGGVTLHGAQIVPKGAKLLIFREYAAVREEAVETGRSTHWDRRWQLSGPVTDGLTIGALGPEGLHQAAAEDRGGLPAAALHARPALWDGDRLVACAALGFGPAHDIALCPPHGEFPANPAI